MLVIDDDDLRGLQFVEEEDIDDCNLGLLLLCDDHPAKNDEESATAVLRLLVLLFPSNNGIEEEWFDEENHDNPTLSFVVQ